MSNSSIIILAVLIPVIAGIIVGIIEFVSQHYQTPPRRRRQDNQTPPRRRRYPPHRRLYYFRDQSTIVSSQVETVRTPQPQNHSIQVPHCYAVQVPPSFEWEDTVDLTPYLGGPPFPPPLIPPELAPYVCPHCGYENEIDSLFCMQCGTEL